MMLSIIVPCFNEINNIEIILKRILQVPLEIKKEIIIVDDFSTDGTRERLKSIEQENNKLILISI